MKRAFLGPLWFAAFAGLALLVAGTAGKLHPVGDALAVFRWQMAGVLLLLAALLGALGARKAIWLLVPASLALAQTGWAWFQPQAAPDAQVVLYQKNLSFRLVDPDWIIADIRTTAPDVLTLQEVTRRNEMVMKGVADILPTQHLCAGENVGGPALATRWPAVEGTARCGQGGGIAAIKVTSPSGPLWLVSLHMAWPWPYGSPQYVRRIMEIIAEFDAPVLIGGDFNMVPWGAGNARVADATGTVRVGRALNTYPQFGPLFPLPIDHVYAPKGATGRVDLRPLFGSDHRGLLAKITF